MIPQLKDELRHKYIISVFTNEPKYKDPVLAQVLLAEFHSHLLVQFWLVAVVDTKELLEVAKSVLPKDHCVNPDEKVESAERGDENQPEPDEDENLFVKQVDGQHALDSVVMHVGHLTDFEKAVRDSWKSRALGPAFSAS